MYWEEGNNFLYILDFFYTCSKSDEIINKPSVCKDTLWSVLRNCFSLWLICGFRGHLYLGLKFSFSLLKF